MGEYARSLAIARAAARRWTGASVHFLLSAQAPYAAATPFPHTLLPSSPTFHTDLVIDCLRAFRPDAVVFDNAGRTRQLAAARDAGAAVIYISSRPRQRRKGFRWRWMGLLDEHWIAYPRFIAGAPGPLERLKLAMRGRPRLRYLDYILSQPPAAPAPAAAPFVLVVPGGGTGHPGAMDAVQRFAAAAAAVGAAGIPVTFVGPVAGSVLQDGAPGVDVRASLPQAALAALLQAAAVVVVNGGSTLLQAIASGRACVAVPIAGDQHERIRRCTRHGVAIEAALDGRSIAGAALGLWRDDAARAALGAAAAALGLVDGIEVAVGGLAQSLRRPD